MIILLALLLALAPAQTDSNAEQQDLQKRLSEAGSSPNEIIRAIEQHLVLYPKSNRIAELERTLTRAAIEIRDNERILRYGERHLARDIGDLLVLERVTRLLVSAPDKAGNERALRYAVAFETGMADLQKQTPPGGRIDARMREDLDRGMARAFIFQAQAWSNLGKPEEADRLARRAFEIYPSAEAAREIGRALLKRNKPAEALPHFADAFALPDPRLTDADRAALRTQMGQIYSSLHGNEKGLGDIILAAYDRSLEAKARLEARLRAVDPNAAATSPMDFTLTGLKGDKLDLKTLRGKVVVLDFWATWCGPCRIQYPMYEQVKAAFQKHRDLVFLGINTDEDHSRVQPFLDEQKWNKTVYFEDGLSSLLKVTSIPTTIIFNRKGEVAARMNGFVPDRFVEMLSERIREALAQP